MLIGKPDIRDPRVPAGGFSISRNDDHFDVIDFRIDPSPQIVDHAHTLIRSDLPGKIFDFRSACCANTIRSLSTSHRRCSNSKIRIIFSYMIKKVRVNRLRIYEV